MFAASTTNTLKPSPSGTSASIGTASAVGCTPTTICAEHRLANAERRVAGRRDRARTGTPRVAESIAAATWTTVAGAERLAARLLAGGERDRGVRT